MELLQSSLSWVWMETIAISSLFTMKTDVQHAWFQKRGTTWRVATTWVRRLKDRGWLGTQLCGPVKRSLDKLKMRKTLTTTIVLSDWLSNMVSLNPVILGVLRNKQNTLWRIRVSMRGTHYFFPRWLDPRYTDVLHNVVLPCHPSKCDFAGMTSDCAHKVKYCSPQSPQENDC